MDTDVLSKLKCVLFKKILKTDATMVDGQNKVAKYFGVEREWSQLNNEWYEKQQEPTGYKRYYELLFLVKSESAKDHIWVSFFEGMHRHAAIIAGLLCSKFSHVTNELKPGSLTLEDFKIDGAVKNFKDPKTTVGEHLDQIFAEKYDAPMFHHEFTISAYVPTTTTLNANELIGAARIQSVWISNFKKSSATTSISKLLAMWLETTLNHTTKETRKNPNYRPALGKNGHNMKYQEGVLVATYKKQIHPHDGDDQVVYEYPKCLQGPAWDAYIRTI